MSNKKPSRYERAKSECTEGRCTVNSIKKNFSDNFFNRLRTVRSKSVDRFRQLYESYNGQKCENIRELRKLLSSDIEATTLLNSEEVADVIRQIEEELKISELEEEAKSYLEYNEQEISTIVNHLMNKCTICNNLTTQTYVCENCVMLAND